MTRLHHTDDVVYEVALNEHPLLVGEESKQTDDELRTNVEERTEVSDGMNWPAWFVFVSHPPDGGLVRYVNTATRINVLAPYETDVFEEIASRVEIEGFDMDNAEMSHWGATHPNDFNGEIHLDLTGDGE